MGSEIYLLLCLLCLAVFLLFALFFILVMWFWMLADWTKRQKTDPATAERFKFQILIGWPFGYYFKVYKLHGPAERPQA